jgi:hypothetical protein
VQALGGRLHDAAGDDGVGAGGQVRAMLLDLADGEEAQGVGGGEVANLGAGELVEAWHGRGLLSAGRQRACAGLYL